MFVPHRLPVRDPTSRWDVMRDTRGRQTEQTNISKHFTICDLIRSSFHPQQQTAGRRVWVPEWWLRSPMWERRQRHALSMQIIEGGREGDRETRLILTNIILICSRGEIGSQANNNIGRNYTNSSITRLITTSTQEIEILTTFLLKFCNLYFEYGSFVHNILLVHTSN